MNQASQIRMTNDEIRRNCRITKPATAPARAIRHSCFGFHSSFVIRHSSFNAFTLIELLVVMAIIGILATVALPALKGFGKGTGMAGAQRQLLQDLGLARLSAINGRSTVFVVFVPSGIMAHFPDLTGPPQDRERRQLTNLISGQYSAYALLATRTVGDQPGQANPHYLSEWKRLPQGIVIATNKFGNPNQLITVPPLDSYAIDYRFPFATNSFPFPASKSPLWTLPYIEFNSQGQIASRRDELIPLAEGSIFFTGANGYLPAPDVVMKPPDNYTNHFIRVNWLTGRASVDEATRPKFN
jgi:prepilin-type N-terminal cleavage/methylation domain-containing protein